MCCLIVCPGRNRPSLQVLEQVVRSNPHGLGLAWREKGSVSWFKSDNVKKVSELAAAIRGDVVIHARWASVGGIRKDLRHPFPVTPECELGQRGSAPAVLFQNGTWSGWQTDVDLAEAVGHEIPAGAMSDARAAAWLVHIHGDYQWLEEIGSRWVYFAAKSKPVMIGDFQQLDGCYYSNLYWNRTRITSRRPAGRGATPRPKAQRRSSGKAARKGPSEIRADEVIELPDRMPAVPWFKPSTEFRSTLDRVRAS